MHIYTDLGRAFAGLHGDASLFIPDIFNHAHLMTSMLYILLVKRVPTIRTEAVAVHFKSWTEESQKKQQPDKTIQSPSSTSDPPIRSRCSNRLPPMFEILKCFIY